MSVDPKKSFQLPETLEPMVLMSASAAELSAEDLPQGTSGNDLIISLTPDELIDGGAGHDIMIALGGNNVLRGGAGHDTLISVRGDNVLDGGAGIDKAVYWNGNRADFTVTNHGFGIYEIAGSRNSDFITNIEQVQFQDGVYTIQELLTGTASSQALGAESQDAADQTVDSLKTPTAGNDVLVANLPGETIDALAGDDIVVGLGNGNTILGSDGNDAILPAGGSNLIDGGAGKDTVIYGGVQADYTLEAVQGRAISVSGANSQDVLVNVETLSFQDGSRDVATLNLQPPVDVPVVDVPVVEAPVVETPVVEAPVEEAPVEEAPVEEAPVEEAPVEEAPVEEAPVEEAPVDEVPVDSEQPAGLSFTLPPAGSLYASVSTNADFNYELIQAPGIGSINFYPNGTFDFHAPVGFVGTATFEYRIVSPDGSSSDVATLVIQSSAPVEEAPVEEAPVEEAPVEEAPVEEAPVEEAPVEEAPVEEAPVEEAPVEEPPVEEAPVEEPPVEEPPVEEPAPDALVLDPATAINLVEADGYDSVSVEFTGENAGYRITVGCYLINNETGEITDVKILFENASLKGSGGSLYAGTEVTAAAQSGYSFGFFLLADGYSKNDFSGISGAQLSLEPSTYGLKLVANRADGSAATLNGDLYISTHPALNPDGKDHFRFAMNGDSVKISIEDLYNLGDHDFNDVVLTVSLNAKTETITPDNPYTGGTPNVDPVEADEVEVIELDVEEEPAYEQPSSVSTNGYNYSSSTGSYGTSSGNNSSGSYSYSSSYSSTSSTGLFSWTGSLFKGLFGWW